jgi:cysteine desulfurase
LYVKKGYFSLLNMSIKKHTAKKETDKGPVYLDCNATTPLDPAVREVMLRFLTEEYGNEGSRTHEYGARAKQAVQRARDQVAAVVGCQRDEVLFTSGATESNNLAILGLTEVGEKTGRKHVVSSRIEHKAVLEPLEEMECRGFEVTLVGCDSAGRVRVDELAAALRPDTLLVSLMQVNNETGVRQPVQEAAELLAGHAAYFHVDAAQGFGKEVEALRNKRVDMISVSGHKVFAPKGVGALITRRRGYDRVPLKPLLFGGGQERGLRPGTLPVGLIAALGEAAEQSLKERAQRQKRCEAIRERVMKALWPLGPRLNGSEEWGVAHVLNVSFPGLDSEALMVGLKDLVAISNGSACTSHSYTPSHVLEAMGMTEDEINGAVRLSWCHLTPELDWEAVAERIQALR